jgi:hypothetical protein
VAIGDFHLLLVEKLDPVKERENKTWPQAHRQWTAKT